MVRIYAVCYIPDCDTVPQMVEEQMGGIGSNCGMRNNLLFGLYAESVQVG